MNPLENWTEIVPNLFMGAELLPHMPHNFNAVVCCKELSDWAVIGPVYLHVPMLDIPAVPMPWCLDASESFLDSVVERSQKNTLVHCTEGHNRSGLAVANYLINHGYTPQAAIDLIRSKRSGALTNATFIAYLLSL